MRASVHIAAQMVLAPKAAPSAAGGLTTPPPRSGCETPESEPRGPEQLYYDTSRWTDAYKNSLRASSIERVERARLLQGSPRPSRPGTSMTGSSTERSSYSRPSSFESDASTATQPTQPTVFRLQPRVCVMCDHAWKAKIPESRFHLLKCPNCLSNQPGEDELTSAEMWAQAAKCKEVLGAREAEMAKRRKARMAERSRLRRYDQPWTPQLASVHKQELAAAHERDMANEQYYE